MLRTMRTGLVLTGLVLLAALGGCGGGDEEAEAPGGGDGGGARLEGPLTYTRGGGIAGRSDRLVVRPDGSGTVTTRQGGERSVKLTPEQLTEVADELRRAKLAELPERSVADPPAPDAFAHRVVYGGVTVTADDPSMPTQLRGLVGALGRLVDRHGGG